ncbi:MAG: PilZ domain-containing protein [Anaeromyxobacter sp.]
MSDAIVNPRRVHRATARCRTAISSTEGEFVTETEDIGARGCQVVSPRSLSRGRPVTLLISSPKVRADLKVQGRVAWVSPQPPWRLGIAFDGGDVPRAAQFMESLMAAYPAIAAARRIPERIATDATVYLGAAPSLLVDFTDDELRLLRAVGVGTSVGELRAGQGDGWPRLQRAFFSLLGSQHLTLSRPSSSHPTAWRHVLGDACAPGPARGPTPAPRAAPEAATASRFAAAEVAAPPRPSPLPPPLPPAAVGCPHPQARAAAAQGAGAVARALDPSAPRGHAPDHSGAGVGWRARGGARPAEAQECYDRAAAELDAGRAITALALLRRALALAPGDAEIAAAIGAAMFRHRH